MRALEACQWGGAASPAAATWAHACNSRAELAAALEGDCHFIEADIMESPVGSGASDWRSLLGGRRKQS